jgi:hypothetical protein
MFPNKCYFLLNCRKNESLIEYITICNGIKFWEDTLSENHRNSTNPPVVKSTRKTRQGTKAGRNVFRSIRTVVTTNRALCAYQSSGRTSTHSNLILITLQCSSKVTVDSIEIGKHFFRLLSLVSSFG